MVMRGINMIVVHCTDSAWGEVEEIRRWHRTRGFDDIGYHYLICNRFPYYKNLKDGRPDPLFDGKVQ
ncbi:MAG: N-acetylmuramoyl-L-alanine amidase, partial [candidate division Zixibacteria bacterium]|nr:N-acetylmuramoyl-L-alanine amidase [candidate division Zixibacteria bacterium]